MNRPTPETDAAKRSRLNPLLPDEVVPAFVCARIEIQRDQLLEALESALSVGQIVGSSKQAAKTAIASVKGNQ
jgi:hypothetical protein